MPEGGKQRGWRTRRDVGSMVLLVLFAMVHLGCSDRVVERGVVVRPTLEDVQSDGQLYTSSTQSIFRGRHWLETVTSLDLEIDAEKRARLTLQSPQSNHWIELRNVPFDQLVPRLHYIPAEPPDAFDAFNLMLAEYSRNGLSMPRGEPGDRMAYFASSFQDHQPWTLRGDYSFEPSPDFMPLRVSLINNCLAPGLWEITAVDTAGEMYHSWFDLPLGTYERLTAETNRLPLDFVRHALPWKTETVAIDLDRLRQAVKPVGSVPITVLDGAPGYSSQDSRRKLVKGFLAIGDDVLRPPTTLADFRHHDVKMSDFVPPGKYSSSQRKRFDVSFLFEARDATLATVQPTTSYRWNEGKSSPFGDTTYLEISLDLGELELIIGNLPLALLVEQEELAIHGFGVGILPAGDFAERRALLLAEGHHPSFAYLVRKDGDRRLAINSHDAGVEQIFLRALPFADEPHLTLIVTSFERIADLVKYRIPIPPALQQTVAEHVRGYRSPIFFTYRDDNIR